MKAAELRNKTIKELRDELHGLLRERFNLAMQKGSDQMSQSHQLKRVRRDIARVKTVMNEQSQTGERS